MNLFFCCTMYQLINAINLTVNHLDREETDLLLCYETNFDRIVPTLEKMCLFRTVYQLSQNEYRESNKRFSESTIIEKYRVGHNPRLFSTWPDFCAEYQELYLPVDSIYVKMLYYYCTTRTGHVNIHYYDEGLVSYVIDVKRRIENDGIPHKRWGEKAFYKNIEDYYLYEPDFHCIDNADYKLKQLDKLTSDNLTVPYLKELFNNSFGGCSQIEKPYVFFVEAFIERKITVEDAHVLDLISNVLTKEKIMVKLHPRELIDRFSVRGYNVETVQELPWEIQILNSSSLPRAAFSFSSTANLTAKMVFDKDMHSVFLYKLPVIGARSSFRFMPRMDTFMNRVFEKYKGINLIFAPSCTEELMDNLLYIKGMSHE